MSDTENTRILPVQMTPEECATKALQLATVCHAGPRVVDKSQPTP